MTGPSQWKTFETSLKSSTTALTLNNGTAVNITHGQNVPIQVSVTGSAATPTGTVSLMANMASGPAQSVASATLTSGSATFSTVDLPGDPAGQSSYTVFAQYSGDAAYASSQSNMMPVTVGPEPSTTKVIIQLYNPSNGELQNPTPSSINYGFFYAVVRTNVTSGAGDACSSNGIPVPGNYGCPTGSVTVTNSVNGGAVTPFDAGTYSLNSQGYAEDQNPSLAIGSNTIKASYPGDDSYLSSTGSVAISVAKALGSVLIAPPPTADYEDPYTVNVTVEGSPLGAAPTGQVSLYNGSAQIGGPVSLSNGIAGSGSQNLAAASAAIVTSQLPLGTSSLTVKYTGDNNYTSNSVGGYSVLTQYLTSVAVASSSPTSQRGSSVTFTATVTAEHPGGPAMTGTVTFLDGGFSIGAPVSLVNGRAQFIAPSLSAGNHAISVQYSGDTNYTYATGTLLGGETVNLLSTMMMLATSNASIAVGQSVTLTATVSPTVPGGPAITGFVGFHTCPTTDTNNCLFALGSAPVSNGQAQLITTIIPSGTIEVLADYDGDSNYNYSSAITSEAAGPLFSISANPSALVISAPGQSASTTLTFTSQNGATGSGAINSSTCGTSFSEEITCSLTSFTLPANGTTTATLIFNSTAAVASIPNVRNAPHTPGSNSQRMLVLVVVFGGTTLMLFLRRRQHRWRLVLGVLLFAVIISGVSCGGGSGSSNSPPPNPGTPAGNVSPLTVSITINGVTQTVPNLTLTVN